MWAEESNFYHIYPLGLCSANAKNRFNGEIKHNLYKIEEQICFKKRQKCLIRHFIIHL